MQRFRSLLLVVAALVAGLPHLAAQNPLAVVNAASFASPDLPNGDLPQGGIAEVFGTGMSIAGINQQSSFPLSIDLNGTSVAITVGGQTVAAIPIRTINGDRVALIVPSGAPLGDGTLTVTFNGQTSSPISITIVAHSFGTFSLNSGGSGPGVMTNPAFQANTLFNSAAPGSVWTIWGTGIGAAPFSDADPPQIVDLPFDVQVLVGNRPADILYKGRTSCCSGLDQINIRVPSGVTGCYVPVTVVVEGVASNFTTMSIADNGGVCSDSALGIDANVLSQAQTNGELRFGSIFLNRIRITFDASQIPSQTTDFEITNDSLLGSYVGYNAQETIRFQGFAQSTTIGACTVFQFSEQENPDAIDPIEGTDLDAGAALSIMGPGGTESAPRSSFGGGYFKAFGLPSIPGFLRLLTKEGLAEAKSQFGGGGYYQEGTHTVAAPGGADVGAHSATIEVPGQLTWTNPVDTISRSSPHTVTWQGGSDFVRIFGFSAFELEGVNNSGAMFFCTADAAPGNFTIPTAVLSSMPPTVVTEGVAAGSLSVGSYTTNNFTASGIDIGLISHADVTFRFGVKYE